MAKEKEKLPIETPTKYEFNEFKEKYLDREKLSEEVLKEIQKLFKINTNKENEVFSVYCDEYHPHTYRCLLYNYPAAGIVQRLIDEIHHYKNLTKDIKERIKEQTNL